MIGGFNLKGAVKAVAKSSSTTQRDESQVECFEVMIINLVCEVVDLVVKERTSGNNRNLSTSDAPSACFRLSQHDEPPR